MKSHENSWWPNIRQSVIISREGLILTLSILTCPQGRISWFTPCRKIDDERMSVLHQSSPLQSREVKYRVWLLSCLTHAAHPVFYRFLLDFCRFFVRFVRFFLDFCQMFVWFCSSKECDWSCFTHAAGPVLFRFLFDFC